MNCLRKAERGAGLIGLVMVALAGDPAHAHDWNMYSSYSSSVTLSFNNAITAPVQQGRFPQLNVTLPGGHITAVTMDTGSTGMAIGAQYVNTAGLQALGPGSILYTTSNTILNGTFYQMPVQIAGGPTSSGFATASVQVLVVPDSSVAMMGVGFDRGGNPGVTPVTAAMNPFLNITAISGQAVQPQSYRTGYVVTQNGVTLGLTRQQNTGWAMVKLTPNTIPGFQTSNVWNRAQTAVTVNGTPLGTGSFLPDTGIAYMALIPGSSMTSTACPSSVGGSCATNLNNSIQLSLAPGVPGSAAPSYGFTVGDSGNATPVFVKLDTMDASNPLSTPVAVNSGQAFYMEFNYLFDYDGGYVGYAPAANSTISFVALLSLQNTVSLPSGFSAGLPVYLVNNTTLAPQGTSAFTSTILGQNNNLTIAGPGSVTFNGLVNLGTGVFTVQQGQVSINGGLIAANATTGPQGWLGGSGLIVANLFHGGTIAPGNSIGTLNVVGNYTQLAGSTYQAEIAPEGQSDLINIFGAASIQGGTVNVVALPGMAFAPRTTYTLLSATGGVTGTFASVNELYPFLQSSLSYDANNAYLTLQVGGFAAQALNNTQYAVGAVLDANAANATGDFATVLGTLATATAQQGQAFMTAVSGNNYAGFSTSMVQGMQLFMNNFANQTGGGGSPVSNRVALAEACDVACDATTPPKWGAWGGALGGLGTIGVNQPVGTVTYNVGGFAAGLDRLMADNFRMGVTAGYTSGTQWVGGFDGLGRSDTFQAGLYGSFAQDKVYADGVIGYAYSWNQMWRNIAIAGLPLRTAQGRTGANQWYGQLETGYRFDLGTTANAFVTPFARLQAYTGTQNAFTETGAQSLNLTVAQQTTNSVRSVVGAQLGGSMDLGWREKLLMQLRLGWSHEYADTGRPVSATFAGAPAMPFTTYGVAPQRDGVVLGLSANTVIADATSVYLRYEGDISGQDSAHALTAGVRMTW
jgi:uncharacterized protein with beta-barrel porin domain